MYTTTEEKPADIREHVCFYNYRGPFEKAIEAARHYGFHLVEPISVKRKKKKKKKNGYMRYIDPKWKEASLGHYLGNYRQWQHPLMLCHTKHPRRKIGNIVLEIFGSSRSIAEGLLIRTALAILSDENHKNLHVDVNSLGNKHSYTNFREEFEAYYRKHLAGVGACCQTTLRNSPLEVMYCDSEECKALAEDAPRSIAFLSESDRTHLKEIIEYIEAMEVSYRINSTLLGHTEQPPKTIFQIKSLKKKTNGEIKESKIVGRGERYDYLSTELGEQEVVPAVAVSVDISAGSSESFEKVEWDKTDKPQIYFIHLGVEAKRASMQVLERLRKTKVHITQELIRDSLSAQLRTAEHLNVPYAIIMGLKEVNEGCVIVRDMFTRAQENVPVESLEKYLRKVVG